MHNGRLCESSIGLKTGQTTLQKHNTCVPKHTVQQYVGRCVVLNLNIYVAEAGQPDYLQHQIPTSGAYGCNEATRHTTR